MQKWFYTKYLPALSQYLSSSKKKKKKTEREREKGRKKKMHLTDTEQDNINHTFRKIIENFNKNEKLNLIFNLSDITNYVIKRERE